MVMDGLRGFRERLHDCFVRRFRRLGPVRLRGGHLALAQVRRGDEPPFSRLPLPPLPPLDGPADRGGLGLPARRGALLRARLVGRPRGRPPREARGGRQRGGSRAGTGARRSPAAPETPLFVFDAGYDPVRPQRGLEGRRAQILVRLHSGRTFYAEPEIPPKRPVGRPSRHGRRFSCKDPRTWPAPAAEHEESTGDYGAVRVRAWSGLHPKTRRAAERYGSESAAVVEGTVVLSEDRRTVFLFVSVLQMGLMYRPDTSHPNFCVRSR
jgi:hypothetical protein